MIVGVPKEIKDHEYRVALVPAGAEQLCTAGHRVLVERSAGSGTSVSDDEYREAGAEIIDTADEIFESAELIIKVKEPQPQEYPLIRPGQIVYTFFHFAASETLTRAMVESGSICVAYETIQRSDGTLPILTPMSEVAGRMAIQEGAKYLERPMQGRGILLGGVPGVLPANVVILGGGTVGYNAAKIAAGMGANVTIIDINTERMRHLDDIMPKNVTTLFSNPVTIREQLARADLLVGAVLVLAAKAPILVTRDMLKLMKPGAVIVDVSVDQGGCIETIHPTTHSDPTYMVENVVHYAVSNMPGAVSGTSTYALTNETLPYALRIANEGFPKAMLDSPELAAGLNIVSGKVVVRSIAEQFGYEYTPVRDVLS